MNTAQKNHYSALISIIFLIVGSIVYSQEWYPTVDVTSFWTVGSFNNASLSSVYKTVKTSASTSTEKSVFYLLRLENIRNQSTQITYGFTKLSESIITNTEEDPAYKNGASCISVGSPNI
jgi:hypothetical protein